VERVGLRQLHPLRALFHGLPGRQRCGLHGAQNSRGNGGGGPCAGRAPRRRDALGHLGQSDGCELETLQAQIRGQKAETGLDIPLDVEGADYMVLLSSMETVNFPEYIGALARIFDQAGIIAGPSPPTVSRPPTAGSKSVSPIWPGSWCRGWLTRRRN